MLRYIDKSFIYDFTICAQVSLGRLIKGISRYEPSEPSHTYVTISLKDQNRGNDIPYNNILRMTTHFVIYLHLVTI